MKLEISYKNSLIGSLSAGESLALHLNGSKLTEDLIVRAVGEAVELPSLSAPTIEIADSTLNIYDEEGLATSYDILVDGEVVATVSKVSLISFTIDGTEYQAEEGMTWEAWVASEYNTNQKYNFDGAYSNMVHSSNAYYVYNTNTNANASKGNGGLSPMEFTIVANGVYATRYQEQESGSN